jgi:hypothetical protein
MRTSPERSPGRDRFLADLIDVPKQRDRAIIEALSGLGENHPAPAAKEECDTEIILQSLYVSRKGRLREMDAAGRLRDTAVFGRRHEEFELIQPHRSIAIHDNKYHHIVFSL